MRKSKIKKVLICALAVGVLTTTSITSAFAADLSGTKNKEITSNAEKSKSLSQEDKETLNNWLKKYDVNDSTRESLLNKLEKGDLWDSVTSKEPVKSENLDKNTSKKTYADGSISITAVDNSKASISSKKGGISLDSISEGETESGSGYKTYTGSRVYQNKGLVEAQFFADYTYVQNGDDYIDSVYDEKVKAVGCSISSIDLSIVNARESSRHPASAKLDFIVTGYNGSVGGNCYLKLNVGNDTAYSSYSY
jgi:hypothetical protein